MNVLFKYAFLILIITVFYADICLKAQNEHLINYSLKEGLPQSQVYDVIQDNIGFLWLGTQGGGLARFDGKEFQVYNESSGLLSNFIQALYQKGDTLFIGTNKGLSIKVKNEFINFPSPFINKIIQIQSKVYYSTQKGIWTYSNGDLQLATKFSSFKNTAITDIYYDGIGYWLTSPYGLWYLKNEETKPIQLSREDFSAVIASDSLVFAASFVKGISVFRDGTLIDTIENVERINAMMLEGDHLWVSTSSNGIFIYDKRTLKLKKRINKNNGLKTILNVKKCFKDKQSNIWIATSGGGLYKYAPTNFTHFTNNTGLLGNRIYALAKDKEYIIASNSGNGLVRIGDQDIERIEDFNFFNVKVKTISIDSVGSIWAGTNGKGILIIEKEIRQDSIYSDSLIHEIHIDTIIKTDTLSLEKNGLPSNWIRKILIDNQNIWVATYASGIAHIKKREADSYEIKKYGIKQGLKDLLINDLALDTLGRMWYSTKNGALGYILKNKIHHFPNILNRKVSIGSILIRGDKIFLGTIGEGIWWSNSKDTLHFYPLSGQKQLFSDNIYQLIFDNENYLWAGSEKGVDKILLNNAYQIIEVLHFGANDGFLGIETCLNAIEKDESGNIWFGTINGLTKYQALEQKKTIEQPTIFFGNLELVYHPIDSIDFQQFITKPFEIAATKKHLSLNFRTIDLNHPEGIEYRWRLDDIHWSNWTKENKVNFANLDYGTYTFQAQSRNIDWNESEPIQFQFTILTPWYKQEWFSVFIISLLLLLIGSLIYRYINQLKSKNKAAVEKLELQNHLLNLEQKALQLQMNPHFIFNILNGIKSMGMRGDTKTMNVTINTFASLLRGILNNSRQENISLSQELKTLHNYIKLENKIQTKPFTYVVETHLGFDAEEIMIPPMLIQPFVENSIRHGLSAVIRDGLLKIIFSTKQHFLHCEIIDNGIGIEQSKKNQSIKDHQSVALQVTKERISSLSGENAIKIEEVIENNSIKGTKVWFKIPLVTDF